MKMIVIWHSDVWPRVDEVLELPPGKTEDDALAWYREYWEKEIEGDFGTWCEEIKGCKVEKDYGWIVIPYGLEE